MSDRINMSYPSPYPHGGYPQQPGYPAPTNGSAIALLVTSILTLFFCGGFLNFIPGIMAVIALVQNSTDPVGSRKLTKIGWIVFGVLIALSFVLVLVWLFLMGGLVILGITTAPTSTYSSYTS